MLLCTLHAEVCILAIYAKYVAPPTMSVHLYESHKKKLPTFASNSLGQPLSSTNHVFSLAVPIDHTYQCHVLVLFPLNMLSL